jgi:hypothetical protein
MHRTQRARHRDVPSEQPEGARQGSRALPKGQESLLATLVEYPQGAQERGAQGASGNGRPADSCHPGTRAARASHPNLLQADLSLVTFFSTAWADICSCNICIYPIPGAHAGGRAPTVGALGDAGAIAEAAQKTNSPGANLVSFS